MGLRVIRSEDCARHESVPTGAAAANRLCGLLPRSTEDQDHQRRRDENFVGVSMWVIPKDPLWPEKMSIGALATPSVTRQAD